MLFRSEPSEPAFEGVEAVPLLRSPLTEYLAERGIPYALSLIHIFTGNLEDCKTVKEDIKNYLNEALKLELSDEKTLITNCLLYTSRCV